MLMLWQLQDVCWKPNKIISECCRNSERCSVVQSQGLGKKKGGGNIQNVKKDSDCLTLKCNNKRHERNTTEFTRMSSCLNG